MIEKITLDMLTQDSVSVKTQQVITQDETEYDIGLPHRKSYVNSINGRKEVENEIIEPYKSVIMLMWGDTPLIVERES